MTFAHSSGTTRQVVLPRRSVLVMTGESRYSWTHAIVPRKTDVVSSAGGLTLSYRQTRVSFTFRSLRRAPCHCGMSLFHLCDFCAAIFSVSEMPVCLNGCSNSGLALL